jgi:hypothetical protein
MLFALNAAFGGKLKTAKNTMWTQHAKAALTIEAAPDLDLIALDKINSALVKKTYALNTTEIRHRYEAGEPIPTAIVVTPQPPTEFLQIR